MCSGIREAVGEGLPERLCQRLRGVTGVKKSRTESVPLWERAARQPAGWPRGAEGRAKREPARSASAIARSLKRRAKPKEKSIRILKPSPCPLPEGEGDLPQLRLTFIHHATVGDATRGIPSNQNESRKANWTCRAVVAVLV